jgi:hypothetical protein
MQRLPTVVPALDGSVGIELTSFDCFIEHESRPAFECRYTARSEVRAGRLYIAVVFVGDLDRVLLHAYDLPRSTDVRESIQAYAVARIGEYLDTNGLSLIRNQSQFLIKCLPSQFKLWRERVPADVDQIEQYIRYSLYWSWRFAQEEYEFSVSDALRLGISIQQLGQVARLGEGVEWEVIDRSPERLSLRPTQRLLRAEKDRRASARNRSAHLVDNDHNQMSTLRLFISHSSKDVGYVEALINLLRSGLNLPADQIRCTSVDGYRLPAGADSKATLRGEIHASEAFIGVVSKDSLQSQYVMFELGARWGAGKHLIPLLAPGTTFQDLSGPMAGLNALEGYSAPQLQQLVQDLASALDVKPSSPAAYYRQLEHVLTFRSESPSPVEAATSEQRTGLELSPEAAEMLRVAASDPQGAIYCTRMNIGTHIQSNGKVFGNSDSHRDMVKWEGAIRHLTERRLLREINKDAFEVTEAGYEWVDNNRMTVG